MTDYKSLRSRLAELEEKNRQLQEANAALWEENRKLKRQRDGQKGYIQKLEGELIDARRHQADTTASYARRRAEMLFATAGYRD